jgi:hypothetical protein
MKKGVYIVSEQSCLYPFSGAGKHIQVGLEELRKKFIIDEILFCEFVDYGKEDDANYSSSRSSDNFFKKIFSKIFKWWYILFHNHIRFFRFYRMVRGAKPDFIYERAAYLNFNGLMISKLLRIPHFYEVNGIFYKDNSSLFFSVYNFFSKKLEKLAFKSSVSFFVGGLNNEYGIPDGNNALTIQNGIENSFVEYFEKLNLKPAFVNGMIDIVFVGHAMNHHRLDILTDAINKMVHKNKVRLHLVGGNYKRFIDPAFEENIEVKYYGILSHEELIPVLKNMTVGVVPYALDYYSNMKIFLYGAAKLVLVLPRVRNFKKMFTREEVVFFENNNSSDLAVELDKLAINLQACQHMREHAFLKVKEKYVWPHIFSDVANRISSSLS